MINCRRARVLATLQSTWWIQGLHMDLQQRVQEPLIVHGTTSNALVQLVICKRGRGAFLHWLYHSCVSEPTIHRYINMDYLFFSSMCSSHGVHILNISYDIACQWNKHLWLHISAFPHKYHLNHDERLLHSLYLNFTYQCISLVVKPGSCSTLSRVLGGWMAKLWSAGGQILTLLLQVLVKWDLDPGEIP
jgi:hypothetical protein